MQNKNRVFIIAEAGVNHNGKLGIAKKMINAAAHAGVDAIKFQSYKTESMITKNAQKAQYQKRASSRNESQYCMLKKLELSFKDQSELMRHCKIKKILFLSSPFDQESIDMLYGLGLKIFKIPSGEITNYPYIKHIGSLKKKIILSTGMSNLKEINGCLNILVKAGTNKKDITVLHCNTDYPTSFSDANLRAMATIKKALGINVGYSDHTLGIEASIAAVAMGSRVIEKHFTLNREMKGPDHKASLEPHELKAMVHSIRNIEKALGNGEKKPSASEIKNQAAARKSIVAFRDIKKGERFDSNNITVKRPGNGISPMKWSAVIGKKAKRGFHKDDLIAL